jgi:hypothetical protein
MVAQARYRGDKMSIYRSLQTNEWEDVFEELVKELLVYYRVELTSDLALKIEEAKPLYDPSRISNWKPGKRYVREIGYEKASDAL